MRMGKNKNYRFVVFLSRRIIENSTKKNKKNKKNTIIASFEAKIVLKRPRKSENKNYRFVPFLPDAL